MATETVADTRRQVLALAMLFIETVTPDPRPDGALSPEDRLRLLNVATQVIRGADACLRAAPSLSPAPAEWRTLAHGFRRAAFLLLQRLNPNDAWFWTEQWQAGENEIDAARATENHATGKSILFQSDEELLAFLEAHAGDADAGS